MLNYLVFMPGGKDAVTQHFPTARYRIADDLWAIGSQLETCLDVCGVLGVDDAKTMVVVRIDEYYGRFDKGLWQKLDSWGKADVTSDEKVVQFTPTGTPAPTGSGNNGSGHGERLARVEVKLEALLRHDQDARSD